MGEQIIRLKASDFDETMTFLARGFAEHAPHDFENLLPALYRRTDEHMSWNHGIRQDGRLVAVTGLFPIEWMVGDVHLRIAGIGGVCTDPTCRGQGLMQRVLTHALDVMRQEGFDLSFLGGQRQRYRYFGWDRCGIELSYRLTRKNIEHDFRGGERPAITFEPMSDDPATIQTAKALYDMQPLHCVRSADSFYHYISQWMRRPHAARDPDGAIAGYLVSDEKGQNVYELVAADPDTTMLIARAWVESTESASFVFDALPAPVPRTMGRHAENISLSSSGNWQVFDWPRTVDALLRIRHGANPLPRGSVVLGIDDAAVIMRLHVDGDGAGCEATSDSPDLLADALTMLRLLFGPSSPSVVLCLPETAAILEAWCPLPLSLPSQDHV